MSDQKPPLADALRRLAERERRSLTGHPTPAELAAYHAGELAPDAEARVREHLAVCRDCSDLLLDLAGFADLAPPPGVPELTDAEVEQDWQSLRARLGEGEERERKPAEVVPIRPAAPVRPERTRSPWLAIAASLLAVLALSFGLYQRRQVEELREPSLISMFDPDARRGPEAEPPTLISSQGGSIPFYPKEVAETYEVEIRQKEKVVWNDTLRSLSREQSLHIPPRYLKAGSYEIRYYSVKNGERELIDEFGLKVR